MRIHELSKILNVPNKEIIKVARDEFGIKDLKNHMSSVTELEAKKIQRYYETDSVYNPNDYGKPKKW